MTQITIYTTPTCTFCQLTKEFFNKNNVTYREVDVSKDHDHNEVHKLHEQSEEFGIPVIVFSKDNQEFVVIGYQPDKLAKLIGLKNKVYA
ncbi:MAG: glutaredoxin family protein [Patescibacteria group bacterium]